MKHRIGRKLLASLLALVLLLGLLPGAAVTAYADGPTVLECTAGESDGVIYYMSRVTGTGGTSFVKGENYIFVPGGDPKPYLTVLPAGSGILKVEDRQSNGHWYNESSVTCYVGVVRRTAGFDSCPHGTLNYNASEYNCWAGGVRGLKGGSYTDTEYSYGSLMAVTVRKDGAAWSGANVKLYRGDTMLEEGATGADGVYTSQHYYPNGTYALFVNGNRIENITVNAKPKRTDVDAPGTANADGFRYITDMTFGPTLEYTTVGATATLNHDQGGGPSDVPGVLTLQNGGAVAVTGTGGTAELLYRGTNGTVFDVVVGGTDTGHTVGNGHGTLPGSAGTGDRDVVNFYRMKVTLNSDRPMSGADVTLRDANGEVQKILTCDDTLSAGGTAVFTGIMQEEESAPGVVSSTPTDYYVYVNGKYIYQTLQCVPGEYETEATFYTVDVTVQKDNAAWTDAALTLDNGLEHYMLAHTGSGAYSVDVLAGDDYTLTVEGVIDPIVNTISASQKSATLDYYTVKYYTYAKSGDGTTYAQVSDPYRAQIVRGSYSTSAPSDAYVEGLTFRWYSATPWDNGDAYAEFDYAATPITEPKSLYAQFAQPKVEINEFLRTDENGAIDGNGVSFRRGNLTVSGYDVGEKAVLSAQVTVTNMTSVKLLKNDENYTVKTLEGSTLGTGESTSTSVLTVTFGEGVSMAAAQEWLRASLLFTPMQGTTVTVEETVSDGDIATAETTVNTQGQVTEGMTRLDGTINDLASGYYYVEGNVSYDSSGTASQSGLRIQPGATVSIYVKSGATLTAIGGPANKGRNGGGGNNSGDDFSSITGGTGGPGGTGGGAGIYVPANAALYLSGEGTVIATGGKGGNGGSGGNGAGGTYWHLENYGVYTGIIGGSGGGGGAGGGGAGAGIGSNGGAGGKGGNGGTGFKGGYDESIGIQDGGAGGAGANGSSNTAGLIYINTSKGLTVTATGGAAGTDGGTGGTGGTAFTHAFDTPEYESGRTVGGGGGGGGGGWKGGAGADIGAGGTGGGGAGGGGGGSCDIHRNNTNYHNINPQCTGAGEGGKGAVNGEDGKNENGTVIGRDEGIWTGNEYPTQGGTGGASGTGSGEGAQNTVTDETSTYNITFSGASSDGNKTYPFGAQGNVIVPDIENVSGKYLVGWQVSDYGGYLGSESVHPLTSAETTLYQPGESITIAAGTYGDITMTAILRDKVGIQATDRQSMDVPANLAETATNYYTYAVQTTLDGVNTDMGPLTLSPESGDVLTLTADTTGLYTVTISENTTYTVASVKYPGMGALGTVSANSAEADPSAVGLTVPFETLTVNVLGYDPESVTLKSGDTAGPTLTKTHDSNTEKSVWQSVRVTADDKGAYDVYVEGVLADAYRNDAVSKAAYGKNNAVTVSYCVTTATVSGNEPITSIELRENTSGAAVPLVYAGSDAVSAEPVYSVTRLRGTAGSYTLYVNGMVIAGQTADFEQDHSLSASLNRLTVNTIVDGSAQDAGIVTTGGKAASGVDVGRYQLVTTDMTSLTVQVGSVNIGSIPADTLELTAALFTVRYKNGEEEIPGKGAGLYLPGAEITVQDETGARNTIPETPEKYEFGGWWSDGTEACQPGEPYTVPEAATVFTSVWNPRMPTPATVTGKNLPFTGEEQELVTVDASTLAGGTMVYAVTTENSEPDESAYYDFMPRQTGAGNYFVWYKVVGDETHFDGTPQSVQASIAKADITPTVTLENWYVGADAKEPIVDGNLGDGDVTYTYKAKGADDSAYSEAVPTVIGEYTVRAAIAETADYNAGEAWADFSITPRYTVTVAETTNGTVTADKLNAAAGETVTLTVTPAEKCALESLSVRQGDTDVTVTDSTFAMPAGDVTVTAIFKEDNPLITGADLVLDGTLYLRFYVYLPSWFSDESAHMSFTVPGRNLLPGTSGRTLNIPLAKAETSENPATYGQKVFACPVYSIEMAKQIQAVFFYENDSSRLERTYSVQDYLDTFTDAGNPAYELAVATRNYGYYMQPYLARLHGFNLETDYPAMREGSAITALDALPEGFARKLNSTDTSVLQALGYYDSFNESTTLTVMVRLKTAVTKVTATVDDAPCAVSSLDGNTYQIRIPNIAANNLGKAYRVVFKADGREFCDLSISALSYACSVLASGTAQEDEIMALSAFYNYYVAAKAYVPGN